MQWWGFLSPKALQTVMGVDYQMGSHQGTSAAFRW